MGYTTDKEASADDTGFDLIRYNIEDCEKIPDEVLLRHVLTYAQTAHTKQTASDLLSYFGNFNAVIDAPVHSLKSVANGAVADVIHTLNLVKRKYELNSVHPKKQINNISDIKNHLISVFSGIQRERIYILLLSNSNKLLHGTFLDTCGSAQYANVNLREMLSIILSFPLCIKVILAHNHPSGTAMPSDEDISITYTVKRLLDMIDIQLVDHFIVAENSVKSVFSCDLKACITSN